MIRFFRLVAAALTAFVPLVPLAASSALAAPVTENSGRSISGFLQTSANAWNHGDLDAFMRGYENSPNTVYMSAKGAIRGYAAIRAHYATHYGKAMGVLGFSDLTMRALGADYAVVFARWHLAMKSGARPAGNFSLVLHRTAGGWHIIEDYTP